MLRKYTIAQSPISGTTLTPKRLKQRGYKAMLDVYIETQPIILRTAVYETRTYGGVRGAIRQFWRSRLLD